MGTIYKIHPAIGIARVGNAPEAFFVGPETPGATGVEIGPDGTETPIREYKQSGRVKRQAARFRVFAYEQDASGHQELVGEVDASTSVEWTVNLVNRKAALSRNAPPAQPRNLNITDRDRLIIRDQAPAQISGPSAQSPDITGEFLGTSVYLGELRTDSAGRLLVLGGRGVSASVPPNQPLRNFANNNLWYDDVSDGPVTATVTVPGQAPVVVHEPAWVVVAPPDFAPTVASMVTLYDIAFQAAVDKGALRPAARPLFDRDIRPVLERMTDLRWVDDWDEWNDLLPLDWNALADPGPAAKPLREKFALLIQDPGLNMYELPQFLLDYVLQWAAGDFDTVSTTVEDSLPVQLDRAALIGGSGNNFFPGIEGGQNLKDRDVYARPLRLDPTNTGKVYPGCLTEIMALPWQADFLACVDEWWPTQRPDLVMTQPGRIPQSTRQWADPIREFKGMVDNAMRLGFVVPRESAGATVLVETERDPAFARPAAAVESTPTPEPV